MCEQFIPGDLAPHEAQIDPNRRNPEQSPQCDPQMSVIDRCWTSTPTLANPTDPPIEGWDSALEVYANLSGGVGGLISAIGDFVRLSGVDASR